MQVVIIGNNTFDSLEYHLSDSFRALGHQAHIIDVSDVVAMPKQVSYWASRFSGFYDRTISRKLAEKTIQLWPNLVLVTYRNLHPELVDLLKNRLPNTPIAHINPDALSNLEKQQIIAANFDYYFSKEPYIVDFLRNKAGLNAHYLPEGFNPRVHQKPKLEKVVAEWLTNIDVLVYGNLYAYRGRIIGHLLKAGIKVAAYGIAGPYLRPDIRAIFQKQYLVGEEKNRLLYGSKIVFNNFHYAEINGVNQKYFETNGVGAFQLCDYKSTIDTYTNVVANRVTFNHIDEAIDKIRYYLKNAHERRELANQQYDHFQKHHSFDQRIEKLIRIINKQPETAYA